ncbi:hypothetical protein QAD02_002149 [Eretmocerus hayati]|uniref:Uncharacterized protein n=1 Tax=Eretmocerus hayati TaxID=131215 RepID=A0ACC2NMX4_9HYME|nr:hypothetical protein QAD02_002149 [Eretmocerus hayati]
MPQSFDAEAEKFQNEPTVPEHLKKLGSLFQSSHSSLQPQLNTIDDRMTVDSCEVRFSGIPSSVNLSDPDVINAILRAIDSADPVGTILSTRRWPTQPARPRSQPQAPHASSAPVAELIPIVTVEDLLPLKANTAPSQAEVDYLS